MHSIIASFFSTRLSVGSLTAMGISPSPQPSFVSVFLIIFTQEVLVFNLAKPDFIYFIKK